MENNITIQTFDHLEKIVNSRIKLIFNPIIDMVERREMKYLLRLPEKAPLRVDWLVLPLEGWLEVPRVRVVLQAYYHRCFHEWVIGIICEFEPYSHMALVKLLNILETPLRHEGIKEDRLPDEESEDEFEHEKEDKTNDEDIVDRTQIACFQLWATNDSAEIAKIIIAAARDIYKGQKLGVKLLQEERHKKLPSKTGQGSEHPHR
jgi:hypothetical protein